MIEPAPFHVRQIADNWPLRASETGLKSGKFARTGISRTAGSPLSAPTASGSGKRAAR